MAPAPSQEGSPDKSKAVQAQVNEVVGIMQNNIERVMERGEKLDSLATKTGIEIFLFKKIVCLLFLCTWGSDNMDSMPVFPFSIYS
jgi:hypothetical protein